MSIAPAGAATHRVDGRAKVTGAAGFAADHTPEGTVHGYLVTSTIGRGTVRRMDVAAARDAPGVVAVHTPDDPLPMAPPRTPVIFVIGEGRRPLSDHDVRYHGQVVGLVLAETFEQARAAAALVKVAYEPELPKARFHDAAGEAAPPPPPFGQPVEVLAEGVDGIDAALAASEVVLTGTYTQPAQQHAALEAHSAVAYWEGGRLTVHSPTQGPALHAVDIAEAMGVDPADVRVRNPYVGGAFGGKATTWAPTLLAAAASRGLGRPVKIVATREQLATVTGHRSPVRQEISLGAARDGTLTALKHDAVSTVVRENPAIAPLNTYRVPNLALTLRIAAMDGPKATIMRAPGYSPGSFALESAMDELAVRLGMDPVELRLRNSLTHAPDTGLPYSSRHLDECLRLGAERFGWSGRDPRPGTRTDGDWLVGTGMAAGVLPSERPRGAARVRLRPDGLAEVAIATADLGTGAWTVLALAGADRLGLPVERIVPALGDSGLPRNPEDVSAMMGAVLSSVTASIAAAVDGAAAAAVGALIEHAVTRAGSPFHGLDPAEVAYGKGELSGGGTTLPFGTLLARTGGSAVEAGHTAGPVAATHAFASYAAYFCEVRVHRWTREPRLARMVTVVDAGAIVNERAARNQVAGAVTMGLGHALMEGMWLEEDTGRADARDLTGYLMPVSADVPDLEVHFLDRPDPGFGPLGARGLAELGCVGSAAAIANAVHHATGRRVRDLPITMDALLDRPL